MTYFSFRNVPDNVSLALLNKKIQPLKTLPLFLGEPQITLTYLGGITNHGLKAEELNLFIRIPGGNADIFINRQHEKQTLALLANKELYSKEVQLFSKGELSGYKIEPFLEGETLQFIDFHYHQFKVLPTLKVLHNSQIKFPYVYDIFEKLQFMLNTLTSNQQVSVPLLKENKLIDMPISELQKIISKLQKVKQKKYSTTTLSPCHNDITPTNFIHLKHPINDRNYQLIDWEYAGMNDPMYDLAGITAMLATPIKEVSPIVCHYFNAQSDSEVLHEIKRVQFYMPIVKLYYAIWAALQVLTGNESSSNHELKQGWGPDSLTVFLEQYHTDFYQELIL